MAVVTLAELKARVLRAVSMTSSDILPADLVDHLNQGLRELDDRLRTAFGEEYFRKTLDADLGPASYVLPADFFLLRSLLLEDSGTWVTVERLAAQEEAALLNATANGIWPWSPRWRYRLSGTTGVGATTGPTTLELLPTPSSTHRARIAYEAQRPLLSDDADSVDYPSGWEEYAVQVAARIIAENEQDDVAKFERAVERQGRRIDGLAPKRQLTEPVHPPQTGRRSGMLGRHSASWGRW